ncbi:hypothetical protein STEG23_013226, partial [Scotinomys teguina]
FGSQVFHQNVLMVRLWQGALSKLHMTVKSYKILTSKPLPPKGCIMSPTQSCELKTRSLNTPTSEGNLSSKPSQPPSTNGFWVTPSYAMHYTSP